MGTKAGITTISCGLLITVICLAPALASAQTAQFPAPSGNTDSHSGSHRLASSVPDVDELAVRPDGQLSRQQKLRIMRANFVTSKNDAAELAALAKGLREELDKPNTNVLSAEVINRLEKIQKLAKKIREETKGF